MKIFLQAEWQQLAMANYEVDAQLLKRFVPAKTELDFWNHTCYVSLVGFMFRETRVKGLKIPFHINFEEVNLRFYVRYQDGREWKRGVVFIREIVPRPALAWVARWVYNEPYETMPMRHEWHTLPDSRSVAYAWKKGRWNTLRVITEPEAVNIRSGSEEEFITEHYWGYTRLGDHRTAEYQVEHPRWRVYPTKEYQVDVDFAGLYGEDFGFLGQERPTSVLLAEGSAIQVRSGREI